MPGKQFRFLPCRAYILYNLLLVLAPILIMVALFLLSMQRQVTNEVVKMRSVDLERTRRAIDQRLENFGSMVLYASLDKDLRPFQLRQNSYETVTALQHLKQHASAQGDANIYFYIQADECFYSPNGKLSHSTFEKEYRFEGGWSSEEFYAMLRGARLYATSPAGCALVANHAGARRYIAVVYPWATKGVLYGAGVGLFPVEWFQAQLLADENHPVLILDENGASYFDADGSAGGDFARLSSASEASKAKSGGETWYFIRQESSLNGWRYLSAVSSREIRAMLLGGKTLLFGGVLAVTLLCAALGVMLAMRYYWPVLSLGRLLGSDKQEAHKVHDHVSMILQNNEDMRLALEETQDTLCQETLARVIWSDADEETCQKWLKRCKLSMPGPAHAVLAVSLEEGVSSRALERMLGVLWENGIYATESHNGGQLALLYSGDGEARFADALAGRALALLSENCPRAPRVGVGQARAAVSDLGQSYIEAVAALRSGGSEAVTYFEAVVDAQPEHFDRAVSCQSIRLAETIRQGDVPGAEDACGQLLESLENLYDRADSAVFRFTMDGVLGGLLPIFQEAELDNVSWKINLIVHSTKPEVFIAHLRPLCAQSAQNLSQKRNTWCNKRIEEVLRYVDAHYADHELSQARIAEMFDLTTASLSRLFSESIGVLFIDYVSQKRMARAAELLSRTEMSIRDIVNEIGYIDVSSFTRKFTKYYGVSPAVYRSRQA